MIGAALYQRLLERAVRVARGEIEGGEWTPDLVVGETGSIPIDYVPDAVTRIGLYGRLARMATLDQIDAFEEELEDRFGAIPDQVETLLSLARLQALARAADVRQVRAGPKGVALTLPPLAAKAVARRLSGRASEISMDEGKVVIASPTASDVERRELVEQLLLKLAP
jgi:transcription-repair coupling factor (superfamily II helicase)